MKTPTLGLAVGDTVVVLGYEQYGTRRIVELYDQDKIPGGVKLDDPVDLLRSWNEDELVRVP